MASKKLTLQQLVQLGRTQPERPTHAQRRLFEDYQRGWGVETDQLASARRHPLQSLCFADRLSTMAYVIGKVRRDCLERAAQRGDGSSIAPEVLDDVLQECRFQFRGTAEQLDAQVQILKALRHVILMCSAVNEIDTSALESLEEINRRLKDAGIKLHFSEVKGPVMDRLKRSHFLQELSGEVFLSQYDAWVALTAGPPPAKAAE